MLQTERNPARRQQLDIRQQALKLTARAYTRPLLSST
jgi:hypothetical protein